MKEVAKPTGQVIEVCLRQLIEGAGSFSKFVGLYGITEGVSPRQAYKLSKLAKAVQEELKLYDEQRVALCKKYGEEGDEGNYIFPDRTKREAFQKDMRELQETEVTIPGEQISLDSLAKIELNSGDLMLLEWLWIPEN